MSRLVPGRVTAEFDWPVGPSAPPARVLSRPVTGASKRAFDALAAAAALVLFAPLMAAIFIAVRLTSPGPGLHWSNRVGRGGCVFRMPKFRTMRCGAPIVARERLSDPDAHITPLGRFLRHTSLDELPQLWSIVAGDMSLIGPRPLIPTDPAVHAREAYPEIARVRPGLSGLAQVSGRNHLTPRKKARYDALYARKQCWMLDLMIIKRTLRIVFSRAGVL